MADYRLPFDDSAAWTLGQANWDDPLAGHGDLPAWQMCAFDFSTGAEGDRICAARQGTVRVAEGSVVGNTFDDPTVPGEGNIVVIEHTDGSAAAYLHLQASSIPADVVPGKLVQRGQEIGRGGNTGRSSSPHLHFEVREWWNFTNDTYGPTVPVHFEDANHSCWRPRSGDTLASNNS